LKTGRVRKKAPAAAEEQAARPHTQPAPPRPAPARRTPQAAAAPKKALSGGMVGAILGGLFACFALVMILLTITGRPKEWVKATQTTGEWTTTVTLFGPQVTIEERWETDCRNDPNGAIRPGTCVLKATSTYNDTVVDEYDEFAYNIYYEETYGQVYEASGTEFVITQLKSDDWWKDNLHYILQEELDEDSCQYTKYTVWVDDPQDKTQEMEVYLSECEVWDHVTVSERKYEQKPWCQCDVTALVQIGQQSDTGTGSDIRWPNPAVPGGGRTEQSFQGRVTFLGDDYTYTATTDDLSQYQDYLTSPYYIGLKDGKPVTISKNPPKK
jgi:hypothetical protein